MLLVHFILLASPVIGIRLPKLPEPEPPKPVNPVNPPPRNPWRDPVNDPVNPPKSAAVPGPSQAHAIQTNMATLERLAGLKDVGMFFAGELVKAIQGSSIDEQPTMTDANLVLPNSTLDMKLYTPCVSYAQKLESCASAVPSFYTTTDSYAQASCACYAPMSTGGCAKSTFNTQFDDYATSCQQFASDNGYTSVASAMNNSLLMPTPHFCQGIRPRRNATITLKATLTPASCSPATAPENTDGANSNMVTGRSPRQLTSDALRDALIVSTAVSGFFWFFFS